MAFREALVEALHQEGFIYSPFSDTFSSKATDADPAMGFDFSTLPTCLEDIPRVLARLEPYIGGKKTGWRARVHRALRSILEKGEH